MFVEEPKRTEVQEEREEESVGDNMKLDFYADEWEDFVNNCGFTDVEMQIVDLIRRGKDDIFIYTELYMGKTSYYRKKKRIKNKILRRIEKAH